MCLKPDKTCLKQENTNLIKLYELWIIFKIIFTKGYYCL